MPRGNTMDFKQQAALFNTLTEVCYTDDDGFAVYKDGWSDRAVAEKVGGITDSSVALRRVKVFGRIRPKSYGGKPTLRMEVDALTARIEKLEEWMELWEPNG